MKQGAAILNDPFLNKGTAFSRAEREKWGLVGLLPPQVQSLAKQTKQAYQQYLAQPDDLAKRLFLMGIFDTNRVLFYQLFQQHLVEFMPIVYDPTIATTIEHYSELFVRPQDAAFLSIDQPEQIPQALRNAARGREIKLIVVTDAEAILGIGDWGTNGVDIAIGKLMIYTAAAGIDPRTVLPVVLDVGTNNPELLDNSLYLGNRHPRVQGEPYDQFVDQFVQAAQAQFANVYIHWEDFGRHHAAKILNRYQDQLPTFNDDIQGTSMVVLAGILGGLQISQEKLTDQVYLCFGAGTAGAGIVPRVAAEMVAQGLSVQEARKHFYLVDKQGLLFADDPRLTPEQKPYARKRSEFAHPEQLTDLAAVVKTIHPTILVGTSTQPGTFTEAIVRKMAAHTKRPIIFPISNPTKLAEAKAADLIKWTDGRALVATGVPTPDVTYRGVTYQIGQANNALIYPGLGLGTMAATARVLNEKMLSTAAHSLGGIVDAQQPGAAVLPPVAKLTQFSQAIAQAVAQAAVEQGLNQKPIPDVKAAVEALRWKPEYE